MIKIKMKGTHQGSIDGVKVHTYKDGEIYNITEKLYKVFKELDWCEDFVKIEKFEESKKEMKIVEKKMEMTKNKKMEVPINKTSINKDK